MFSYETELKINLWTIGKKAYGDQCFNFVLGLTIQYIK